MKKQILYILFALLVCTPYTMMGQWSQGDQLIGGSVSGRIQRGTNFDGFKYRSLVYSINPTYGYFVSEKVLLGMGFRLFQRFTTSDIDQPDERLFRTTWIEFTPFCRFYVNKGLFAEAKFTHESLKFNNKDPSSSLGREDAFYQFRVEPGIGYDFFIKETVGIEAKLAYQYQTGTPGFSDVEGMDRIHEVNLSVGIQVFLK